MKWKDKVDMTFMTWLFIIHAFQLATALKNLRLIVPEAVADGDTVTLSCQYDLENEALYLVRWTLDSEEIFRYVPKEEPAAMSFSDVSGVQVDMRKSNAQNVTIKSLTRNHSGLYQCEVSGDAPLFHTLSKSAQMQVAILPESEPTMRVYGVPTAMDQTRYVNIGDQVKASCISGPSQPFVNFTWRVNDIVFSTSTSGFRNNGFNHSWETQEAWSELLLTVDSVLMSRLAIPMYRSPRQRQLRIRCETNIYSLYRGAAETLLEILDDFWPNNGIGSLGGKVSPTIDQRGSNIRGDPDNSALTGSATWWSGCFVYRAIMTFLILFTVTFH